MKLPQRKKSQRKRILIITVLVLVVAGIAATAYYALSSQYISPQEKARIEEEKTNNQAKKEFVENTTSDDSSKDGDKSTSSSGSTNQVNNPGTTKPTSSSISVDASQSNDTVIIKTNVGSISTGTCKLTATNGSRQISQTADILYQPQYSTCTGFSIPVSKLGIGTWNLSLTVTANGAVATTTSTLEVK